ncbi:CBS domain-containing protein [Oxalobacteraceae bacterium R-40]|uniref:CBS domain-containing protein n=1 Tax=Keguizhuia sedimenti TaxID=3064264 RepID=A0ABU1BQW7_9BURK|nr:CBS domain-containing protein [Oxalobacteraceae bacterium R-40]
MQMVSEVMSKNVQFVSPQESLQRAAQMMDELNVGSLPVCDGDRLVGMITDRDITVRATAAGKSPSDAHVDEIMSKDIRWCFEDQPLDEVMIQMADSQIRRVPVVSHDEQHKLVGIVALGDIATKTPDGAQKEDVEQLVEMVSSPSAPVTAGSSGKQSASGMQAGKEPNTGAGGEQGASGAADGVREWGEASKKLLDDEPFGSADVPRPE